MPGCRDAVLQLHFERCLQTTGRGCDMVGFDSMAAKPPPSVYLHGTAA